MGAVRPAEKDVPPAVKPGDEDLLGAARPADKPATRSVLRASVLGLLATAALLGVVTATAGVAVAGWIAGLAAGSAAAALLAAARMRSDQASVHPADWVTLTRAVLAAGVAGLVADSFSGPVPVAALVTLSVVALVLGGVNGQVARRTGTAAPLDGHLENGQRGHVGDDHRPKGDSGEHSRRQVAPRQQLPLARRQKIQPLPQPTA